FVLRPRRSVSHERGTFTSPDDPPKRGSTHYRDDARVDFLSAALLTWQTGIPRQTGWDNRSRIGAAGFWRLVRKAVWHESTAHSRSDPHHCRDRSGYCASVFGGQQDEARRR